MSFKETLKNNLVSAVQTNAEDKQNILPNVLKKTIEDTKIPQTYLLRVVKTLREQINQHKGHIAEWKVFLQSHKGQMQSHEARVARYHEEFERIQQIKQGEPGEPGQDGKDGESPAIEDIVQAVLPHIPSPIPGEPGKDASVDEERLISLLLERVKKEKPFDMSHIKGAQDFIFNTSQKSVRIKFEELMHGGGSSSGSGGGYQQPLSGAVNGINQVFTWTTAPDVIVVDQGRPMQKVSSDGTVNWTGTMTTTLAVAPNYDIFALS